MSILNRNYGPTAFSYWLAQVVAAFAALRKTVAQPMRWLEDFVEIDGRNEYLFCSLAIATSAAKAR